MKQGAIFFAVAAVITLGGAWGITLLRPEPELARAVWSSAVIALGVQVLAFAVARPFVATNPIAGWGLGSLIRFAVVMVHAFVGVKVLGLQSGPALLSLVGFLFVTMLVEPLFLKQ
ncbi:MAG: hypothetical protein KF709_03945 [Gemmatimonadaceae bacterium]|nr:hypothetical protein [Gemmatimonadaceae bacterium]